MKTIILSIEGMTCSNCALHVKESFENKVGIIKATVNLEDKTAEVLYDSKVIIENEVKQALEDTSYHISE